MQLTNILTLENNVGSRYVQICVAF